jgi:cell division protein FtsW (lipid II flippase)
MIAPRTRELLALVPSSLLVTAGFAAIFIQQDDLPDASLTYGGVFLGLCFVAHLVIRLRLPHADPYLFPLVSLLACFGLVMIYRIDDELAREQAQWFVVGLIVFAATIVVFRDLRVLERLRYTIALGGILLLALPRFFAPVNGAYLNVDLGPISFQPAELTKIAIVIFLASYLRDTRESLRQGLRLKDLGPLLLVWGVAMLMLFVIQDLGSSLMFYGGFLAVLYVATNRVVFPAVGLALFAVGARVLYELRPTIENRVEAWRDPFGDSYEQPGGSFQIAQSLFAQADGGLFGTGLGESLLFGPEGNQILPAAQTDLIYALIVNELGLAGALALIAAYLLIVERGFKTATLAQDAFTKLLAVGLAAVFALQVFVIVGGVTKAIPLTGVTLPFVSYGGSSIVANFILLGLLLTASHRARAPR